MTPREELIEAMAEMHERTDMMTHTDACFHILAAIEAHGGGCVVAPHVATGRMLDGMTEDGGITWDTTMEENAELEWWQDRWRSAIAQSPYAQEPKP